MSRPFVTFESLLQSLVSDLWRRASVGEYEGLDLTMETPEIAADETRRHVGGSLLCACLIRACRVDIGIVEIRRLLGVEDMF